MYEIKDSVLAVTAGTQALCLQDIYSSVIDSVVSIRISEPGHAYS